VTAREAAKMTLPVTNAKTEMISILQQQPEDSSYDELLRELAFNRMVGRGLKDMEAGRVVDNEEARRRIKSWQD
jgi:predicted transcriptional regulator